MPKNFALRAIVYRFILCIICRVGSLYTTTKPSRSKPNHKSGYATQGRILYIKLGRFRNDWGFINNFQHARKSSSVWVRFFQFSNWPCRLSSQCWGRKNMHNSTNKNSSSSRRSNLVFRLTTVFLFLPFSAALLALISSMIKWNPFAAWSFFRLIIFVLFSLLPCKWWCSNYYFPKISTLNVRI